MDLIENLISNLTRKQASAKTKIEENTPNSWGILDYNGRQYKFIKGQKNNPKSETYNSFIADVVRQFDKITIKKDDFVCLNC